MDYHALEKMTVTNLRDEAKKFPDIKGTTGMKKEELIALLAERLDIEVPQKTHKKSKHDYVLSKSEIKEKIAALKQEREEARGKDDHKRVNMLRRRIHVLKRETRKIS